MSNWNEISFSDLKGKILKNTTGICKDSDEVVFECTDGTKYRMCHHQDCCESVRIEDVCGDVEDLLNSEILIAEEVIGENIPPKEEGHESYKWTFYKLATVKGYVDIRWYGVSNGYYSESVSFEKCEAPADAARPAATTMARDRFRFRVWDCNVGIYHYDAEDTYDYYCGSPEIHRDRFSSLICDEDYVLEQCTGLADRNKHLVYVGDILRYRGSSSRYSDKLFEVHYCFDGVYVLHFPSSLILEYVSADIGMVTGSEIVGNIHENPGLLKEYV